MFRSIRKLLLLAVPAALFAIAPPAADADHGRGWRNNRGWYGAYERPQYRYYGGYYSPYRNSYRPYSYDRPYGGYYYAPYRDYYTYSYPQYGFYTPFGGVLFYD